nr:MAG TPA: hypothetical protein [Caudoviricetes sp.]
MNFRQVKSGVLQKYFGADLGQRLSLIKDKYI